MNRFINFYIDNVLKTFRFYDDSIFNVSITGLWQFANNSDKIFHYLLSQLSRYGFYVDVNYNDSDEYFCALTIKGKNKATNEDYNFYYNIQDILCLIDLSSKTDIPIIGLIVMKIISLLICRIKTLYKAIVLDLDDTLWNGTLLEDGIVKIIANQRTAIGTPFIQFANFAKSLADNLGIYVAICSRNDSNMVSKAIDSISEDVFPLKHSIDCIVANNNNKSSNLKEIANNLSILPNSIVFIDDNELIRDEVRNKIPEICIPNWNTHEELITLLSAGCIFDRYELSLNAQKRRKQYKIIQVMRSKNDLPTLPVKVIIDSDNTTATKFYKKTNQFNLSQQNGNFDNAAINSFLFELYRESGESLGICSALSYTIGKDTIYVENWAISCRFFEIGLEELILLHLIEKANGKHIKFKYNSSFGFRFMPS